MQICSQFFPWHSHSLARHRCTQVSALQLMVHFVRAQHVILQLLPEKKLKRLHVICKLLQWSQFWELLTCNSFGLTNKKTPVGFFCITLSVFRYTNKDSFYDIFFSEFQWQIQRDWDGNTATPPPPPPSPIRPDAFMRLQINKTCMYLWDWNSYIDTIIYIYINFNCMADVFNESRFAFCH